jgi:hypothetical protein
MTTRLWRRVAFGLGYALGGSVLVLIVAGGWSWLYAAFLLLRVLATGMLALWAHPQGRILFYGLVGLGCFGMAAALYDVITRLEHAADARRPAMPPVPPAPSTGQCPNCRIYYCAEHQVLVDGLKSKASSSSPRGPSRPS